MCQKAFKNAFMRVLLYIHIINYNKAVPVELYSNSLFFTMISIIGLRNLLLCHIGRIPKLRSVLFSPSLCKILPRFLGFLRPFGEKC